MHRSRWPVALSCALALLLGACAPALMQVDDALARQAAAMPVQGRQGWQFGQGIAFGPYRTGVVERSWTSGLELEFLLAFERQQQRLGFSQFDDAGNRIDVRVAQAQSQLSLPGIDLAAETEDAFGGVLIGERSWELFVAWASEALLSHGFVRSGDTGFDIRPVNRLQGSDVEVPLVGYEFLERGRVVAAVELIDAGRVWIDPGLDADSRLALAGAASALLLRQELLE